MDLLIFSPVILLIVLMLIGVPIAFSLALAGFAGIWMFLGDWGRAITVLGTSTYSTIADYNLSTIPLFILMAFFASGGNLASNLFKAISAWSSNVRGGTAVASTIATGVFGAMSGTTTATASVMSEISIPEMRKLGYKDELSSGVVALGATMAILIPPSVPLVIYGLMTETSIGALLLAGVLPGILLGFCLLITILAWVKFDPSIAPNLRPATWKEKRESLVPVLPAVVMLGTVILLLYSGFATPTEIGAIGACAAGLIGFGMRALNLSGSLNAIVKALRSSAMIFLILLGASIFGYFVTFTQIPQHASEWIISMDLNRWLVVVVIIVLYFLLSMFMDEMPLMLISLPITFPIIISLGFDPVWFGVMNMLMAAMGQVFPPVGISAFVVAASGRVDLLKVYKGCGVLLIALVLTTILVMIFPSIALFLPGLR